MTQAAEKIFLDALSLEESERASLANRLLETVTPDQPAGEPDAAWNEKIRRRLAESHRGEAERVPWEQVKAILEERTRRDDRGNKSLSV